MLHHIKRIRIAILNTFRRLREHVGYMKRYFITPSLPVNEDGKVYVNLGSGVNTSKEFVNVDTRPMPHIHYVHPIEELPMFPSNSVDLLYASHVLEHIPREDLIKTLREWRRVLKPSGKLRFGVPDFDGLLTVYERSGRDVNSIVNQLLGQSAPYDDHHTIWNFQYAVETLEKAGFKKVCTWDPKDVDHHEFVDKTARTIAFGVSEVTISLNIEAVK